MDPISYPDDDAEGTKVRIADEAVVILMNIDASISSDSMPSKAFSTSMGCQPPKQEAKGFGCHFVKKFWK